MFRPDPAEGILLLARSLLLLMTFPMLESASALSGGSMVSGGESGQYGSRGWGLSVSHRVSRDNTRARAPLRASLAREQVKRLSISNPAGGE